MVLVEGAGHFCAFTHPDQFLAAMLANVERPTRAQPAVASEARATAEGESGAAV
jgi:hypothetical protein